MNSDESQSGGKTVKGKDGATYTIGGNGVKVGFFRVKSGKQVVAKSSAIDSFQFGMIRLDEVLKHISGIQNHLVKSTISQLAIVTLASLLEAYGKQRMVELEAENKLKSWGAILKDTNYTLPDLQSRAKSNARSAIEQLLEERKLNLNELNEFGRLFEEGFAVKTSDLDRGDIYRIIELRHRIVHGGLQSDILFDAKDGKPPIFAVPDIVAGYMAKTIAFVNSVHERTLNH